MNTVELGDVSVRFGSVRALTGANLALHAGQAQLLAGPNGSGKSTLIRVLLGLVRPDAGTIKVDGALRQADKAFRARLGYLPEAVAFSENLTGRQVARFFADARGVRERAWRAALARVGLAKAASRAVRGYSRGMRQRLGLALAVLAEPELLVLDEPTGGLDQEGLDVLWSVLDDWKQAGRLVLIASHDLTLLETRVERICLLRDGKVVADDSPTALRERAALSVHVDVESTDANACAQLQADARQAPGVRQVMERPQGLRIEVEPSQLLGVLTVMAQRSAHIAKLRVEEPGLDRVYQSLIGDVPA